MFPTTMGTPADAQKNIVNRHFKPLLKRAGLPEIQLMRIGYRVRLNGILGGFGGRDPGHRLGSLLLPVSRSEGCGPCGHVWLLCAWASFLESPQGLTNPRAL